LFSAIYDVFLIEMDNGQNARKYIIKNIKKSGTVGLMNGIC